MAIVCSCGWANDERPAHRASPRRTAWRIVADGPATLVAAAAGEGAVVEGVDVGVVLIEEEGGTGDVAGLGWGVRRNLDQGFTRVTLHRALST